MSISSIEKSTCIPFTGCRYLIVESLDCIVGQRLHTRKILSTFHYVNTFTIPPSRETVNINKRSIGKRIDVCDFYLSIVVSSKSNSGATCDKPHSIGREYTKTSGYSEHLNDGAGFWNGDDTAIVWKQIE